MPLNKQKVGIPLNQGINTKTDENQQPIGSIDILENAVFNKPGRLIKRTGYDKLNTELIDESDIENTQRITTFRDELCLYNKTDFYSYSESTENWSNKGTVSNIFPSSNSIIRNTYQQSNIDSAHIAGVDIYAWEDGRGGIRASIIDSSTGNSILTDTEITSSGSKPRVEYIGNEAYFFYIVGTDIRYKTVNPIRPDNLSSEVTAVSADVNATNKIYDTQTIENRIFFAWNSSTSTLKVTNLQEDGTIATVREDVGETPSVCIALSTDSSSRLLISYYDGTDVKVIVKSFTLTADIIAAISIETIANITNTTISTIDSQNYVVYYEQTAASIYNNLIRTNTVNLSSTVGTASNFIRSCSLVAKSFTHDSIIYVPTIHVSDLQSTIFILNSSAEVVSKISQGIAGDVITTSGLTKVTVISTDSNKYLLASQIKGKVISEDNTLFSVLGVNSTILDFDSDVKYDNAVLGDNLHTAGGMIQSYDGKEKVEHGFHLFPENLTEGATGATGGLMSDGTYLYSAVYSWIDNKGQQHRSAPSIELTATTAGGVTVQTKTINVPTLRITEKSNVVIELYRTEASGTVFYLTTSVTVPTYNDKTVDTVAIVDTKSDAQLISNELLYTTGGVLENIAAPSASIIETFNNRIFLAGLEDKNQIQFSKIRQDKRPVEFNDSQIININNRGGDIVALATQDDKLIIFKETAIFFISGDGPNNLGQQNTFIEPELISSDVGCITQNSVVLTPQGLMFMSKRGIYLLSKSLETLYIGAPVEDYNNFNVTAATLMSKTNQVIFLTDQEALVYNYFVNKWVTFTNHKGLSATSLNDKYYYVRQNNEIYKQASHFTDAGSFIKLKLETSWLSFAGVQAYQRVYRMLILGEYKSSHDLVIKTKYNFLDTIANTQTIATSEFTNDTLYGEDSPYGTGTPYGGTGNQYQVRVNFEKQKCQSLKISIEDSQSSSYGEGLQLSNILFIVGAKKGEYKPTQSRIFTTT